MTFQQYVRINECIKNITMQADYKKSNSR